MGIRNNLKLLLALLTNLHMYKGDIVRMGNDIVATDSGSSTDGIMYLLQDVAAQPGLMYGFSAFFINRNPVMVQVWGFTGPGSSTYQLKKQWRWTPNVVHAREDVYLHIPGDGTCYKVQTNDTLGLYIPQALASVAFEFLPNQALTMQSKWTGNISVGPSEGDTVTFDSLTYPYKFSLAAWIDTDLTKYGSGATPACPTQLFIPNNGTSASPTYSGGSNSIMGATGSTGPAGQLGATGATGLLGSTGPRGSNGAQGSTGNTGPIGRIGDTGTAGAHGSTGATGPMGARGDAGPQGVNGTKGDKGEKGEPGAAANNPEAQRYESCPWCDKFMDAYVIMGLVIWLAVITLIFLIYAVINCCCNTGRRRNPKYNSQDDLWRKYEKKGYNNENHYSEVEEGRTTF